MHTLELKFENESVKAVVAAFLVAMGKDLLCDGINQLPINSVERVGDTLFYTLKPEEPEEAQVFEPEKFEEVSLTGSPLTEEDLDDPTLTSSTAEVDGGNAEESATGSND